MRRVTTVLGVLAIVALAASAANADPLGAITLESGASTNVHATAGGAMWLDTGSGPYIIPDGYNGALDLAQSEPLERI